MENGRILGKKIDIDYADVNSFFEKRALAAKENGLSTTMYSSEDNARKRDAREHEILRKILATEDYRSVVDVGSGLGRLARFFIDKNIRYVGVDNSLNLIQMGREIYSESSLVEFHQLAAYDIGKLKGTGLQFDIAVITGMFIYLNDTDCEQTLRGLSEVLSEKSMIYMREPVSVLGQRLTLKNYFSEDLQLPYNSIYRTPEEYVDMYEKTLGHLGFRLLVTDFAYDESLHSRSETKHKFFAFKKGK